MTLTYWSYLQLEKLLDVQHPRSEPAEHDEMLFIVIHQTYELWFKLLMHELDKVNRDFSTNDLYGAIHTLKRARTVMKTLVQQVDVLETMTPMSFTSFRDRLDTASGFQSALFRELEFTLGYKRPEMLKHVAAGAPRRDEIERTAECTSVMDHLYDFLELRRAIIPPALRTKPVTAATKKRTKKLGSAFFDLYKNHPDVAILFELLTDFDEGPFRNGVIGTSSSSNEPSAKKGTGGSLGVEFLKESLFKPVFPDLWAIRHRL